MTVGRQVGGKGVRAGKDESRELGAASWQFPVPSFGPCNIPCCRKDPLMEHFSSSAVTLRGSQPRDAPGSAVSCLAGRGGFQANTVDQVPGLAASPRAGVALLLFSWRRDGSRSIKTSSVHSHGGHTRSASGCNTLTVRRRTSELTSLAPCRG